MRRYIWNLLIAVDQFFNAAFGGDPDETISSRLGKAHRNGTCNWFQKRLCDLLDWIDPNHCIDSIEEDEGNRNA